MLILPRRQRQRGDDARQEHQVLKVAKREVIRGDLTAEAWLNRLEQNMKHVTLGLEKKPDPDLAGLDVSEVEVTSKPQLRLGRLDWLGLPSPDKNLSRTRRSLKSQT